MLQVIMKLLEKEHPGADIAITAEELVKGRGYLLRYEISNGDGGAGWREWIAYARMTDLSGGLVLEWKHELK